MYYLQFVHTLSAQHAFAVKSHKPATCHNLCASASSLARVDHTVHQTGTQLVVTAALKLLQDALYMISAKQDEHSV